MYLHVLAEQFGNYKEVTEVPKVFENMMNSLISCSYNFRLLNTDKLYSIIVHGSYIIGVGINLVTLVCLTCCISVYRRIILG